MTATADLTSSSPTAAEVRSVLLNAANGSFTGQVYIIDPVAPFVQSINRANLASAITNDLSVSFTATFSQAVTGVLPVDFQLGWVARLAPQ